MAAWQKESGRSGWEDARLARLLQSPSTRPRSLERAEDPSPHFPSLPASVLLMRVRCSTHFTFLQQSRLQSPTYILSRQIEEGSDSNSSGSGLGKADQ